MIDVLDLLGTVELQVLREQAGDVGVPLEAILIDEGENALHLPLVVNVFGKDILVERIARRAVDIKEAVLAEGTRPLGQELPAALAGLAILDRSFQLRPRPEDGAFGRRVEAFGIEHGALVVVAEQHDLALHYLVDAFARIGTVTHYIAEAVNFLDIMLGNVLEDGLEGFEVTVDVADNRLHETAPQGPVAACRALSPWLCGLSGKRAGALRAQALCPFLDRP